MESKMDHREVRRYWNENAETWTRLSRAGYDISRDLLNTPAFFKMLPDVEGLAGLDIGCGEGYNTTLLARRGAKMNAIDIAEIFIVHAHQKESEEPLGIQYSVASAVELPFADGTFDFATGFMSFMDIPETGQVLSEAFRVLKAGGFLQFSISHPCFMTRGRRVLRDADGRMKAIEVGRYFGAEDGYIEEWIFSFAPPDLKNALPKFRTPRFDRTISQWLNLIVETGFLLERVGEPTASNELVRKRPEFDDDLVAPEFLHVRARRPK